MKPETNAKQHLVYQPPSIVHQGRLKQFAGSPLGKPFDGNPLGLPGS